MNKVKRVSFVWGIAALLLITMLLRTGLAEASGTWKLIEHWDGSTWNIIPAPNPGPVNDILSVVTAVSAHNVWAVGQYEVNTSYTLVEHWDGAKWSLVASPGPGSIDNNLYGATEVSANNIWAVGRDDQGLGGQTLIEHWNGST